MATCVAESQWQEPPRPSQDVPPILCICPMGRLLTPLPVLSLVLGGVAVRPSSPALSIPSLEPFAFLGSQTQKAVT